ncbi:hypothetical protein [Pseudooceanicola sp.]|uniref:hypothetical protein n=1 Tax=Pseudooceanicola sp. TaxID=1914328 RepID=UPI0035C6E1A5
MALPGLLALILALLASPALAQSRLAGGMPGALPVDGVLTPDGPKISWTDATPKFAGSVEVSRRPLGANGTASWQVIAPGLGPVQAYLDRTATDGTAWEYRVRRFGREVVDQGYWTGGRDVATPDHRGLAVLVIEDAIAAPLAAEIDRFTDDLTGDGWLVRHLSSPAARDEQGPVRLLSALELKSALRQHRADHPDGDMAIILLGRVPMVASGLVAPDGHKRMPHSTDLFYADLDQRWPATAEGLLTPHQIPDGRIEAMIGRIDLSNMGALDRETELDWLRDYLTRNHDWRHGRMGDLRNGYAAHANHLFVEHHGLAAIIGKTAITEGGHAQAGQQGQWLFGLDFGPAGGDAYFNDFSANPVFAINFGSHKQKIARFRNPMNALMTPPNGALAVAWGGRPAWRLHGMAMGETIGAAQMRSVNNGPARGNDLSTTDYLPTGRYPFLHPIWGNLLGDPTLRAFPIQPPGPVTSRPEADGQRITWQASPQPGARYRVYRLAETGPTQLLAETPDHAAGVLDPDGTEDSRYMVRTLAPLDVPAGSLMTLSQGRFTD